MKRNIRFLVIFAIFSTLFISIFNSQKTFAANDMLFGIFPQWSRGINLDSAISSEQDIPKVIFTIAANIIDGIFRAVGIAAVGFIIWGGYQYMLSSGEPGKMSAAKNTITNAIVGLIIALSASMIINTFMGVGGNVASVFTMAFTFAGIIAVIMIVISGFRFVFSAGDSGKLATAKRALVNSIIGLIIVLAAYAIVSFITGMF